MRKHVPLLALLVLGACASPPSGAPSKGAPALAPAAELDALRALVEAGRPREALTELDAVQAKYPEDRATWALRAKACLKAAENDTQPQFYFEDALAAIRRARKLGEDSDLLFDAAHASRMLGMVDEAVQMSVLAEKADPTPSAEHERVLIEVAFDEYVQAKRAAAAEASDLAQDVELRLMTRINRSPDDVWALNQLANLFLWEARNDAAVDVLGQLVRATPEDEAAHTRFAQLMRTVEGPQAVVGFYESLRSKQPGHALPAWFEAVELFELAAADLAAKRDAVEGFARAEALFGECRDANARYAESCLGYEVMCRAGIGWSKYHAGDDAGAEDAFTSTEDVLPGGVEWRIEGRIASGFDGLTYLADRAFRSATNENDYSAAGRAARIYALLRGYRPNDAEVANNCGFFHREWGVPMLVEVRQLRAQAADESDEARRAELAAQSDELERQARIVMAACVDAYKACADLAPDNIRWVNSYALILVYHYPSRVEEAERLLLHCVEVGAEQLANPALSAEERDSLAEGWGDAHQNLGMIELVHRHDPAKALEWFGRCFDIGPRPRVDRGWVKQVAMRWCERVQAGEALDAVDLDPRLFLLE